MHRFGILSLFLLLSLFSCTSLDKLFVVEDPDVSFENKEYMVAAKLYEERHLAMSNPLEQSELGYRIGECYRLANRTREAESWYESALKYKSEPEVFYKYALMQKSNSKYGDAIRTFTEYARNNPFDRANATRQIRACQLAKEWKKNPTDFQISNLHDINSPASDYGALLLPDGSLIFTSARSSSKGEELYGWTGEKHSDFYTASPNNVGGFENIEPYSEILNTQYNEGTLTFNNSQDEVYFTRCGNDVEEEDAYCSIYFSEKDFTTGEWEEPVRLDLFENDSINVGQPHLSPDGETLFFSADAPGGMGDKDLYFSKKKMLSWSYPKNLGPEVNTEKYEGFPFMHSDGRLYFASNGHMGMGGLDVFSCELGESRWGKVENLKFPINSAADDLGLIFQPSIDPSLIDSIEAIGYVSSSRQGGKGNDDLYRFVLAYPEEEPEPEPEEVEPVPLVILQGTVLGKKYANELDPKSEYLGNELLPDVVVEVLGLNEESTMAARIIANEKGAFEQEIQPNSEFKVSASKPDYFSASKVVKTSSTKAGDTTYVKVDLVLDRIFKEQEIVMDNIYYDLASFEIREDARPVLDKLAVLLQENPSIQIELGAHTDSRGQDKYNQELSAQRASSVVQYISRKGVDLRRMRSRGYGESALVNQCADGVNCSEEQHQVNRRTTFKVISDTFRAP